MSILDKRKRDKSTPEAQSGAAKEEASQGEANKEVYEEVNEDGGQRTRQPPQTGSSSLIDYSQYHMSLVERAMYIVAAGAVLFVIGHIFYQNIVISLILALGGFYYPKLRSKQLAEKRKEELTSQFKQALYSLSSSVAAGKSVENAFNEVVDDLKLIYPDPDIYIIREFNIINYRLENGETLEAALQDFSQRADVEDIQNFVDVFVTSKRAGGNIAEIIRRTANIIGEKIEIQQEIAINVAQKKFESRVMLAAPIFIVGLLAYTSADYMEPLYRFGIGPLIMTGALLAYIGAFWLVNWIMDIKV